MTNDDSMFAVDLELVARKLERREFESVSKDLDILVKRGSADAAAFLGYLYDSGQGVPVSSKQAMIYYRVAASSGIVSSQYNLGRLLEKCGEYPEAIEWYSKAAKVGDSISMYRIYRLALRNKLKEIDYSEALHYLEMSAHAGYPIAQRDLLRLEAKGVFGVSRMFVAIGTYPFRVLAIASRLTSRFAAGELKLVNRKTEQEK